MCGSAEIRGDDELARVMRMDLAHYELLPESEGGCPCVTTFHAKVTRDGDFWLVYVPEVDRVTQADDLDDVERMARDLIATMLDLDDVNSFPLRTTVAFDDLAEHLDLRD